MDFERYFQEQLHMHPSMKPRDGVKLCYQAAFGAEHLLADRERAKQYLLQEMEETAAKDIPLYEQISEDICRVNLGAWKYHGLPGEWLFQIFASSFEEACGGESLFWECLKKAEAVWKAEGRSVEEWQAYLQEYEKSGLFPVHHSPAYRETEHPAYRIAKMKFLRLVPVLEKVAEVLSHKKTCIIALDGRAASGKTTAAQLLKQVFSADVVQMDDFFLPLELRTEERFRQAGGNVHYERFGAEVLPHLEKEEGFSYRIFDCGRMDYYGERQIGGGKIRIVEGSYSQHPVLGEYADICVFLDVESGEQMERIRRRNGEKMAEMFRTRWIPLEEAYFDAFEIRKKAVILLK